MKISKIILTICILVIAKQSYSQIVDLELAKKAALYYGEKKWKTVQIYDYRLFVDPLNNDPLVYMFCLYIGNDSSPDINDVLFKVKNGHELEKQNYKQFQVKEGLNDENKCINQEANYLKYQPADFATIMVGATEDIPPFVASIRGLPDFIAMKYDYESKVFEVLNKNEAKLNQCIMVNPLTYIYNYVDEGSSICIDNYQNIITIDKTKQGQVLTKSNIEKSKDATSLSKSNWEYLKKEFDKNYKNRSLSSPTTKDIIEQGYVEGVPYYNQYAYEGINTCGPWSVAQLLGYWDKDYPNLIDYGNSSISENERGILETVEDLKNTLLYFSYNEFGGTLPVNFAKGIREFCNEESYGNNLSFDADWKRDVYWGDIKSNIDQSKPLILLVHNGIGLNGPFYDYKGDILWWSHYMTLVGYRQQDNPNMKILILHPNKSPYETIPGSGDWYGWDKDFEMNWSLPYLGLLTEFEIWEVEPGGSDNILPICNVSSPNYGGTFNGVIPIIANASDASGIWEVEFEYSTNQSNWYGIGTDTDNAPYTLSFDSDDIAYDASVWVRARAKDNWGHWSFWDECNQSFIVDNRQSGSLKVTLSPSEAVSAGARWNVDGGSWFETNHVKPNLEEGSHIINFKAISRWSAPSSKIVQIIADQTHETSGTYTTDNQGNIEITTPNNSTIWYTAGGGSTEYYSISWEDNISENVRIELYKGNTWLANFTNSTESDGYYGRFPIPNDFVPGTDYQIKIVSTTNSSCYAWSDNFEVANRTQCSITVTSPTNNSSWQTETIHSLIWDDNFDDNVKIELYKDGDFNKPINYTTASIGSYEWTIPSDLPSGINYSIKITNTSDSDCYGYSEEFEIINIPPNSPVAYDATDTTQTSFTSNWSSSATATGYRLDVATDWEFTSLVYGYDNKDVYNDTSFNITGLIAKTPYYYRVRAYNNGGTSEYSNTISVKTLENPPDPPVANEATDTTQTSFIANWGTSETAIGYELDVATNIGFTSFVPGYENLDVNNTTSYEVIELTEETQYFYRVRAYNNGGDSEHSNTISVKTLENPPVAPVANDATDITQTSFTANWSSSTNADGYKLDIATDSDFTSFVTDYNNREVNNVTSVSVTDLNAGITYYYRIRAYNEDGTSPSSNEISVRTLTYPSSVPTNLSAKSCNDLVTLTWDRSVGGDFDKYIVYGDTSINPITRIDSTTNDITNTSIVISGLENGQTYYFRVIAVNYDDVESDFSNQATITVEKGVIPEIKAKWGNVLICFNIGDSIVSYQWYNNDIIIPNSVGQYYVTDKIPGAYKVEIVDINGCVNSSESISISGTKSLSVFPNPATKNFTLKINDESEGNAIISLTNLLGVKVMEFQTEITNDLFLKEISVSTLVEGIYVVQVLLNNKDLYFKKIVIRR